MTVKIKTQVVVLGAGPAGYSAAFRCADLGLKTIIIERYNTLGGVCLNVGCIPSKALLHIAKVIEEVNVLNKHGIVLNKLKIDINHIRTWKEKIITKLTNSISAMAQYREVKIIKGLAKFTDPYNLQIENENNKTIINFENAIIATGSYPIQIPFVPCNDSRIWDSTDALNLKDIPKRMLVIGGGIIGLEISTIYQRFGTEIHIVEMLDQVLQGADDDIVKIFTKQISKRFNLMLGTKITNFIAKEDGIYVTMRSQDTNSIVERYDIILVAIGRAPNIKKIDIEKTGVEIDGYGYICVDRQLRTNIPHIFAIGDVVGQPMLAHKGMHEGHIAAEVIAGMKHYFDPKVIPSIAYTEPEVAWVGLTEKEAKNKGINYETAIFPWNAAGRAVVSNYLDGVTKLIFDKKNHRIIGGAIVGSNGGELLGEIGLAIEMGSSAEDIALTIHAHPTLYESVGLAAKILEGSITDLPNTEIRKKMQ